MKGHYRPLSFLAAELISRGHRVTFVHHPDAAPLVEPVGAGFEPIGASEPPVSGWTRPMAKIRGLSGLGGTFGGMVRFTDMFCREGPAALRRIGADAVLADQMEAGGALVAEHLGLPFASIAVTLPINRELGVPPPYVGWGYQAGEKGRKRNAGGWRVTDLLLRGVGSAIARNAAMLKLPERHRLDDCLSPTLQLTQLVAGIDFHRRELPAHFHYCGPFRAGGAAAPFELPPGDDRPLVYCSLGTLQGSRTKLFRKVAAACHSLDLRLLITTGGKGSLRSEDLPGRPIVRDWVPQEAVLAQAAMVVSHAGMNSVLDPAAVGLPMVLMPLAFEQGAVAARAEHAGVARVLSPRASVRSLAAAIGEVRNDPRYRAQAAVLRAEIAASGGTEHAAQLIESTLL